MAPNATSTTTPLQDLNRFQLKSSGTHFYTANTAEVETVKTIPGYVYEGVAFYLRVPRAAPAPRLAGDDGSLEELDPD